VNHILQHGQSLDRWREGKPTDGQRAVLHGKGDGEEMKSGEGSLRFFPWCSRSTRTMDELRGTQAGTIVRDVLLAPVKERIGSLPRERN
jgi:hypothetical protein